MAETLIGALKSEITRLARKVVKSQTGSLQSASAAHRRDIAALKRQVATLEKQVRALGKGVAKVTPSAPASSAESGSSPRFQARGLRTLRQRLDLSAAEMGQLAGVSAQSIYQWEAEKTFPRQAQIVALAALRGLGKKEARARLESMAA